jgi:3'(2'), 5'-bisphosphate nucleotidase
LPDTPEALLAALEPLAKRAGEAILRHYKPEGQTGERKADGSPVTEADRAAEAIILAGLAELAPGVPVVAEEAMAEGSRPDIGGGAFWLVDPLDGTREFLSGNGEFTVNIALIEAGHPVLGLVHTPALGGIYGGAFGSGAWQETPDVPRRAIEARLPPEDGLWVVSSRSHGDREALTEFLGSLPVAGERRVGSSLKLCVVAAGEADLYARFGRTMEWDIAAGHAILLAAGGSVQTLDGSPLTYGKPEFENPHFVALGKR